MGGLAALALTTAVIVFVNSRGAKVKVDGQIRLMQQQAKDQREADQAKIAKDHATRLLRETELEAERERRNDATMNRFAAAIETSNAIGAQIARAVEGTNDVLKQMRELQNETKARHEANAVRIGEINQALNIGIMSLEGKVDSTRTEVTTQSVNMMQTFNNRLMATQSTIKEHSDGTHALITQLTTTLDTVLLQVNDLGAKVASLQQKNGDDRYREILVNIGEIFTFIKTAKRGTDDLNPAKVADPAVVPTADPIALPTVNAAHPDPVHDTAQLKITPPAKVDMPKLGDTPHA